MLSFDEINKLNDGKRSMSYERYFGEMDLPEEEKKKRIAFSMDLELLLVFLLSSLYADYRADRVVDIDFYKRSTEYRFIDLLDDNGVVIDNETKLYVENVVETIIDTTTDYVPFKLKGDSGNSDKSDDENKKEAPDTKQPKSSSKKTSKDDKDLNPSDSWFVSEDRAKFDAENEANSVFNREDYKKAKASGKKNKRWKTMKDNRVRHSHNEVDEAVVGINDYFTVNGYKMMYPHDSTAPASEILNCRCVAEYF